MAPLSPMTENETVKKSCCIGSTVVSPASNSNNNTNNSTSSSSAGAGGGGGNGNNSNTISASPSMPASAPPTKRTPNDFIFGKVIGEGSFSTVS